MTNARELLLIIDAALWTEAHHNKMRAERPNETIYISVTGHIVWKKGDETKRYRLVEDA